MRCALGPDFFDFFYLDPSPGSLVLLPGPDDTPHDTIDTTSRMIRDGIREPEPHVHRGVNPDRRGGLYSFGSEVLEYRAGSQTTATEGFRMYYFTLRKELRRPHFPQPRSSPEISLACCGSKRSAAVHYLRCTLYFVTE